MAQTAEERDRLRESVRRFLREKVSPLIGPAEAAHRFPHELLPQLAEFGFLGGMLSEADGGFGLDHTSWLMLMEEAGYCWLSLRSMININSGMASRLAAQGTAEQKSRFLAPLLAGKRHSFSAFTEPEVGSNMAAIQARAVRQGDHYVMNGRKLWITNGAHGDFGIVVARTFSSDCDGKLSMFLVERGVTAFESRPLHTMVLRATGTAELLFDDAIVPRANLIGREGDAFSHVMGGMDLARLNIAAGAIGAAQAALDLSVEHAKTRKQFGRTIGEFQLVQKHIVDMAVRVTAARALCREAAAVFAAGQSARMLCSIAKIFCTEAAHEVANAAMQVHGGIGYSDDFPIERIFRDTRGGMIPEGTTEIQTLIVGREILGMSAFA
jgi:alkylation response protein AidB-like acyl-CoA dehydrogenase